MNKNNIPFFLVDAFTVKTSFTGNPAAVCVLPPQTVASVKEFQQTKMTLPPHLLLSKSSSTSSDSSYENDLRQVLQKIANEMQQSETVFVQRLFSSNRSEQPQQESSATFLIRWFTPETEVMLCGHATLAASHCLFSEGGFVDTSKIQLIHYISPSYNKNYSVIYNHGKDESSSSASYTLKFPNNKPHQVDFANPDDYAFQVANAIKKSIRRNNNNAAPIITIKSMWYHTNSRKYIVELSSRGEIEQGLQSLDVAKLHSLLTKDRVFSVTFTAKDDDASPRFVAVSRHFAPWVGIPEDPVTGAAHVVLGPMWVERIEKESKNNVVSTSNDNNKEYDFFQAFPGRGGIIRLRVESDTVVALTVTARTVVRGDLILSPEDVKGVIQKKSKI